MVLRLMVREGIGLLMGTLTLRLWNVEEWRLADAVAGGEGG